MNSFPSYKTIVFCFLIITFSACFSVKQSTSRSGKKFYETFFVGDEGNQYFLKPVFLENNKSKEKIAIDFTFRYKDEVKDSGIINFSVYSPSLYSVIDSINFKNEIILIKSNKVTTLYKEKNNKGFHTRLTTKIPMMELNKIFSNNNWELNIYNKSTGGATFIPTKKSKKIIKNLYNNVFIIM